jgi:hypothetical protein
VLRPRTKQGRASARAKIGKLRDLALGPWASRYERAVQRFFVFMTALEIAIPDEADDLDEAFCLFIDSLWEYGDPKSYGVEAIVGLGKLIPKCRHMYPCARALLKTWQKHEMPVRCPPLTSDLVLVW